MFTQYHSVLAECFSSAFGRTSIVINDLIIKTKAMMFKVKAKAFKAKAREHQLLEAKDLSSGTQQNMFRWNIETAALFLTHNYPNHYSLKTVTYKKNAKEKEKPESVLLSKT